jgi:uncharacterized protein
MGYFILGMNLPAFDFERSMDAGASAHAKYLVLRERLLGLGSALIGFSGGVDSTLLLAAARHALGRGSTLACLAVSPSLPERERREALALAASLDAEIIAFAGTEFENPAYLANGADRCFHCKSDLFAHLRRIAGERGHGHILYGANADDGLDYRPGLRAAVEHGALAPLAEAGLTKAEVRALSRAFGLPTADKPAMPCLASRIPYGRAVTKEKLSAIEAGEGLLREMGFREFRLRHEGETARVEVPLDQIALFAEGGRLAKLEKEMRAKGFARVFVDPKGFRSGNLNAALPEAEKAKALSVSGNSA